MQYRRGRPDRGDFKVSYTLNSKVTLILSKQSEGTEELVYMHSTFHFHKQ